MKRNTLYMATLLVAFTMLFTGCTKEQMALALLYGTWSLEEQLDNNGAVVPATPNTTTEVLVTFFRCNDQNEENCYGSTKTTSTTTIGGSSTTTINGSSFSYRIFGKSQIVWGNTYFEIESLTKKELKLHPVSSPKATTTYKKQ
ncbi:MAG: hypothetical protein KIS94_03840 [Chitinophagales bacterium]|nr:hypothetical protein [Chitinophagales bacterium]